MTMTARKFLDSMTGQCQSLDHIPEGTPRSAAERLVDAALGSDYDFMSYEEWKASVLAKRTKLFRRIR